jgi:hypothetical protein
MRKQPELEELMTLVRQRPGDPSRGVGNVRLA